MGATKFDLIVLGSGAAGEKGAAQAAYFGKKVAMVEREYYLGGATAGTTVPSKTLRETSLALSGLRARRLHGVDLSLKGHASVQDFLHHERVVKDTERTRINNNMTRHNVELYKGSARFVGPKTIEVNAPGKSPELLEAETILIATGSAPRRPDNFPRHRHVYDSDSILQIKGMPKSMVVVGGGVIGCEYACIFAALEVNVSLVHSRDILLDFLDRDISFALRNSMERMGIEMKMPEKLESCEPDGEQLLIKLGSGEILRTDAVMLATGRNSNTGELNLGSAGIETGKYGLLIVDENYQVIHPQTKAKVPGIYAAGDVIGAPALASTSMEQARFAMIKAFNLEPYKKHVAPILPVGIYTIPECSGAGLTEEDCKTKGIDYVAGRANYNQNARGMIIGDYDGFLKLIFEFNDDLRKPMKLLGVHVIGEIASEVVHTGLTALMLNATSEVFINTCFNYPTLGELYKYATYDAMGRRGKRVKEGK